MSDRDSQPRPLRTDRVSEDEYECDHVQLKTVNADGYCLVCGEDVLHIPPPWVRAAFPEDFPESNHE